MFQCITGLNCYSILFKKRGRKEFNIEFWMMQSSWLYLELVKCKQYYKQYYKQNKDTH